MFQFLAELHLPTDTEQASDQVAAIPRERGLAAAGGVPPTQCLQGLWAEILSARGGEVVRILESTRNRLAPFCDSGILRRMFGSTATPCPIPRTRN